MDFFRSEKDWVQFLDILILIKEKEQLNELFTLFFTSDERDMLLKRYKIIKALLQAELSQREIASEYGVSISKVTAGSKALQQISDSTKHKLLKKYGRNDKK